jgi:hypothetical protein
VPTSSLLLILPPICVVPFRPIPLRPSHYRQLGVTKFNSFRMRRDSLAIRYGQQLTSGHMFIHYTVTNVADMVQTSMCTELWTSFVQTSRQSHLGSTYCQQCQAGLTLSTYGIAGPEAPPLRCQILKHVQREGGEVVKNFSVYVRLPSR